MRYRRSALGVGWIFLNLAIMILAVGIIYSNLLGQDLKTFLPFLTIGLVAWGYLTSSIVEGGNAFIVSEGYIKQIGLPTYVYVFRFFVSISITMLISLPAYLVVALVYSVPFRWGVLWALVGILLLGSVSFYDLQSSPTSMCGFEMPHRFRRLTGDVFVTHLSSACPICCESAGSIG
jgi:ABC-type polysaccharide/polyol phosphate export permease